MDTEIGAIVVVWPRDPGAVAVGGALVPAAHLAGAEGIVVDCRPLAYRGVCVGLNVDGAIARLWMRAGDVETVTPAPCYMRFAREPWPW